MHALYEASGRFVQRAWQGTQFGYAKSMRFHVSPSRRFLWFWVALIAGLALGRSFSLPGLTLGALLVLWVAVLVSGQDGWVELTAISGVGILGGLMVWQLTGGESWLHLNALGWLADKLALVRTALADRIFAVLPEPHGSLLSGILLGNRVRLDKELISEFRLVGLSHIIAVSGYNLTILTANIRSLLKPYLPRSAVLAIAALVIVLFVLLSGAPASILRAAVMAGLVLVAEKIGRPAKSLNLLIIAASVLALFEPKIIFDIGFQLSVIATYGLIRLTPQLTHWLAKLPLPKALVSVLAETLAATIVTAPILIIYFERLSLGSPLVNLLVVPLVPLVMGLGLIGGLALFALPAIGVLLTWLTWPILEWILRVTHYFASLAFVARDVHWPLGVGLAVTAGLILCVELGFWQYWQTQKRLEQE